MPNKTPIKPPYQEPNRGQIKLIQTAANAVGLRQSGQYYLLLAQYRAPDGTPVTSCKQMTNAQIDNFLAICESLGFRHPGRPDNFYRYRDARRYEEASFAQQAAIRHLAGDQGWNDRQLAGMLKRMTFDQVDTVVNLSPKQAHKIIEALKNMVGRSTGRNYKDCRDVQADMEVATDGNAEKKTRASQVG